MPPLRLLFALLLYQLPLIAADDFIRYEPKGGVKPIKEKVGIKSVRLLDVDEVLKRNITPEKIAAAVKEINALVAGAVPEEAGTFELLVKVTLTATEKPRIGLASNGKAPEELLQGIYDALKKTADLRSKTDPIGFEIHIVVQDKP